MPREGVGHDERCSIGVVVRRKTLERTNDRLGGGCAVGAQPSSDSPRELDRVRAQSHHARAVAPRLSRELARRRSAHEHSGA